MEAKAIARHVRVTPRKARRMVDLIRGKKATEAITILKFAPQDASLPVRKVLESAIANARVKADKAGEYTSIESFSGKSVGAQTGTTKADLVTSDMPGANLVGLTSVNDLVNQLVYDKVDAIVVDGAVAQQYAKSNSDLVVADVPCSGLGIIRKKPDIRYKNPRELAQLPALQRSILENAAGYVRPGGTLVYSTCTILPEENQDVTADFLRAHPDFALERFTLPQPIGPRAGQLTLWPQRFGTDGFYICRMHRNEA